MYGSESWIIKKAECRRTDAFELWCWRILLRIPWTARRSNQLILKEISLNIHWKDWCWSLNSNTLATWCKELTHWKRPWCWERLKGRGEGGDREWDGWMASLTQWTWVWASSVSWWWTGKPGALQSMGSQRVEHDWATELNWTENVLYINTYKGIHSAIKGNEVLICPHGLTLKTCSVKEASHKGLLNVWFHLYEMSTRG